LQRLSFVEHPASVGETYVQHLRSAWGFSLGMIGGGLACFVHGLFPFLFVATGSSVVRQLHGRMIVNRRHCSADAATARDATLVEAVSTVLDHPMTETGAGRGRIIRFRS
jgi:hypothetical protein